MTKTAQLLGMTEPTRWKRTGRPGGREKQHAFLFLKLALGLSCLLTAVSWGLVRCLGVSRYFLATLHCYL